MNKKLRIHPLIKGPLILFILVLIFSSAIIAISGSYMDHAYDGRQSEKRAMRIWKNKIDGSRQSNKIIDQYENRYLELVKNNIVGEEDRLDWLENIQAITNARNMPSVKYDLSSQQLVEDKTGQHKAQGLKIYRSDMVLDMKMAHEGDLFAILNTLEDNAKGLFVVDQCNLEKSVKTSKAGNENMSAHCELGWYTFKSAENDGKS
ncbi:MAG: hypothetical protein OQK32_03265 [Gammaproteobacteria bacterium]|nr:hypothetical protein [Gammaproteobacteria bacterium]MCW8922032.1 hypothetical protein [Gammaproteobacteria bacterium]